MFNFITSVYSSFQASQFSLDMLEAEFWNSGIDRNVVVEIKKDVFYIQRG